MATKKVDLADACNAGVTRERHHDRATWLTVIGPDRGFSDHTTVMQGGLIKC